MCLCLWPYIARAHANITVDDNNDDDAADDVAMMWRGCCGCYDFIAQLMEPHARARMRFLDYIVNKNMRATQYVVLYWCGGRTRVCVGSALIIGLGRCARANRKCETNANGNT